MGKEARALLRVVIATKHRLLLEAVKAVLEPEADLEVVGVTHEADRILALVADLEPDLVLLESQLSGMDGMAILDRLRTADPAVAVVLLSESPDPASTTAALERGAQGVILTSSDPELLAPVLRAAIRGERPQPEPQAAPPVENVLGFTPREEAVLQALGRGLSNAEIARELAIGTTTVRAHLVNAYGKLGVSTRLEAFSALVERAIFGNPYNWL